MNHGTGEYVRDQARINRMESFRSMPKRAHEGVYHKLSAKHLQRYVQAFACRHNVRESDAIDQVVWGRVRSRPWSHNVRESRTIPRWSLIRTGLAGGLAGVPSGRVDAADRPDRARRAPSRPLVSIRNRSVGWTCRESDIIDRMATVAAGMIGRRLCHRDLIADNGLCSGTRS